MNNLKYILFIFIYITLIKVIQCQINDNIIDRKKGNILRNITRTQQFKDNIVTSQLDASNSIRFLYRGIREVYSRWLGGTGHRDNGDFLQKKLSDRTPFPCKTNGFRSKNIPTSVHQLRPGDIDVIAALGDSLTSATGANSIRPWEILVENRGLSWCIGGQETWRTHLTIPNILKEFNPNLFGYSLGDSYSVDKPSQFNVAENIATTSDMPYNAKKLMNRMKLDSRVNMNNHWKLLTLMIGGNDFCSDICFQTNATQWMNEVQEKYLIQTLRYLREKMPRTLVNLVPTPLINLSFSMDNAPGIPLTCHVTRPLECSCLFGPAYSKKRKLYRDLERKFVKIMERVSHLSEFHTNDFTVVYQPFFKDASVYYETTKTLDLNIMAIDCIHFSQKGHAISANGLWNNMLERNGNKTNGLRPVFSEFKCPTKESPYIYTYFNS